MTRRELERRLDAIEDETDDPAESLDIQINRYRVVSRDQAEREGREILGPVDTPGETEHVKVDSHGLDR